MNLDLYWNTLEILYILDNKYTGELTIKKGKLFVWKSTKDVWKIKIRGNQSRMSGK
jgi:hypothetical protein